MKVIYCSRGDMEDTPAAVDRTTGILYINPKRYFKLTPFQRKFVKFHEYGHYNLNTDSELAADEYAFNKLAGSEFKSLQQCIECLEQILDENVIGHKVRIDRMYDLALKWDKDHPEPHLNKATQGSNTADVLSAADELMLGMGSVNMKSISTVMNSLQNMMNSLLISAVIIIAMIFILKED